MRDARYLTRAELQVMDILWRLPGESGFINDMLKEYPEPKPAYTTLATFLRVLKEKGFVKSENVGKMLRFSPLISKKEYTRLYMKDVKNSFFDGSVVSLVSFFAENEELSEKEVNQLMEIIKKGKQQI